MTDLSKLSFGAPAAERDTGLGDYFVESEAYQRLAARQKMILLGNRGTGKSAIFDAAEAHILDRIKSRR